MRFILRNLIEIQLGLIYSRLKDQLSRNHQNLGP
jgi:hypothetical protein